MYIAIAGNIASGKTTLTKILAESLGWKAHYESSENNPYLTDFYDNMLRWGFEMQVYLLNRRFRTTQQLIWSDENVIQDRTIYEDAYIFAQNLFEMGVLSKRDFTAYLELFSTLNSFLRQPDLIIYLKASVNTLVKQINLRQLGNEDKITTHYLQRLNDKYDAWAENYPGEIITINADNYDFIDKDDDKENMINIVKRTIGLIN